MSHKSILTEKSPIKQFLFSLGFFLYFSKPVLKHIEEFIKGSTQKGYKGTRKFVVRTVYECAQNNVPIESIFKTMKVA